MAEMRHTKALKYSVWERLYRRLNGRWPQRVADRRLEAYDRDVAEAKAAYDARQKS